MDLIRLELGRKNQVTIRPAGYLGQSFNAFRGALEGAKFDGPTKTNYASLDKVPRILTRLRDAGFQLQLSEDLAEALKGHEQEAKVLVGSAVMRLDRVEEALAARGLALFGFQRTGVEWLAGRTGALLADEMGLGKDQAVSEPVLTPNGWSTMGALRVGDEVIGSNGQATKVLGVYPQGRKMQYRVTMTDGAWTRAGAEHLWYVETPNSRFRNARGTVKATAELLRNGVRTDNGNSKWFIPLVSPVQYEPSAVAVEPYLLGALLANGTFGHTTVHHGSEEQREELAKVLPADIEFSHNGRCSFILKTTTPGFNSLTRAFKAMALHGHRAFDKFIPEVYMVGSVEQRHALLQGLMDNDGTISADGKVTEYNTVSPKLAEQVIELIRSLGGSAWMSTRIPTYEYKGEKLEGQMDHRIRMALPLCPFRVKSKRERYSPRTKYPPAHAIGSIIEDGEEESVCIRVEADDHLYVTRDYILTHNTVQTLAALPDATPIVVVAPAVAKGVWLREARKWRPEMKVTVLSGRGSFRWPEPGEMIVINYDILPEGATDAPMGTCLVADEAHALKNFKAKRTQKFRTLSDNVRAQGGRTWLLTATPLLNRPTELWGILSAAGLEREVFGTWGQFVSLFGGHKDRWGGMQWGMPSAEVPGRLARVSLRRMRAHVLPDLPVKTWQDIEVDLGAALTRKCDALTAVLEKDGTSLEEVTEKVLRDKLAFTDFSAVRAALATAKIPALMALVDEFEEQDEPVVVFSAHRAPIDQFLDREGWAVITGDTSPEERTRIEEAFQAGQLRGVAATIQAGGVAITLTRSHNAIFVDRDWTPAINNQAEDRICRIGQSRGCIITNLVGSHKIERRMSALLTIKTAMATAALPTSATVTDEAPLPSIEELIAASSLGTPEAVRLRAQANPEAVARALAASVPPAPKSERQVAQNAQEEWAYDALMTLAGLDTDRAAVVNGVGFNKMDGDFGHSLAQQASTKGLTRKQWAAAIKLCGKYYRQVGRCPEAS